MALLPVTELKQWAYCPRVVFFHQVMPGVGQPTYKMKEAVRAQEMIESLEMRRTLREYGLESAGRQFGVWLTNDELGLSGKLDLLLKGSDQCAIVDFKLTSGEVGENHRMQLAGYACLVEAELGLPVQFTFLYRIPDNKVSAVPITETLKVHVKTAVRSIRRLQETQEMPAPTEVRSRCTECEYANYCADIW
jgi:CRISPR-associated exonuclease Cas4